MVYGAPPPEGSTPGGPPFPPPGGPGGPAGPAGPVGGGYGGPPGFPPPMPPPRRGRGPLIAVVAVVAVLVIVGAVVIVLTAGGGGEHPTAARTPAPPPSPTPSPTATPTLDNRYPPTVPGWRVIVASQSNGLSYDVPADWKDNGEGSMIGLDDGTGKGVPETAVDYSAESKKGECRLGGAGFRASDVDRVRDSVLQGARRWAKAAAREQGSARQSIGTPQKMKLKSGGWVDQITARVTMAPDKDNCGSTGTTIHIVGLPTDGDGSLLFVLYVHTGQHGALSDADMDKVVHSVRLAK